MDPAVRRRAGNAVREVILAHGPLDAAHGARAVVELTADLDLSPHAQVELADRLSALLSIVRVVVRTVTPEQHLPKLGLIIDAVTDRLVMADTEGSA